MCLKGHWPPLTKHEIPYSHPSPHSHLKPCTLSSLALCFQAQFGPNNGCLQSKGITPNATEEPIIRSSATTADTSLSLKPKLHVPHRASASSAHSLLDAESDLRASLPLPPFLASLAGSGMLPATNLTTSKPGSYFGAPTET